MEKIIFTPTEKAADETANVKEIQASLTAQLEAEKAEIEAAKDMVSPIDASEEPKAIQGGAKALVEEIKAAISPEEAVAAGASSETVSALLEAESAETSEVSSAKSEQGPEPEEWVAPPTEALLDICIERLQKIHESSAAKETGFAIRDLKAARKWLSKLDQE